MHRHRLARPKMLGPRRLSGFDAFRIFACSHNLLASSISTPSDALRASPGLDMWLVVCCRGTDAVSLEKLSRPRPIPAYEVDDDGLFAS